MTEMELFAAFGRGVYDWHRRQEERAGEPILCSCGQPVVLCPYRCLLGRLGLAEPVGPVGPT